ncbi:MAG TPA: AAA family ATPase [Actinomycetota bacterium]|nr:AAA family ATPase [Actinomycetota bacterium]
MEKETATNSSALGLSADAFQAVAADHKADVRRIRETNRKKRLRYAIYVALLIGLYLTWRYIENRPAIDFPNLGPDAMLWMFPVVIILVISAALLLPLLINGRSPHLSYSPEEIGLGFSDVKGVDNVLEEVTRTLQIFLTYRSFKDELGGNPRRGLLFEGHPGTGKTHMAKAMAAEAGVPFFFVSAPAFTSMYQGASARKVRSFFKALKKAAAKEGGAIGFIEEIDAVGRARGGVNAFSSYQSTGWAQDRMTGGGDTSSMVNELLIQLQSFDAQPNGPRFRNWIIGRINSLLHSNRRIKKAAPPYNNVLIIGATNRADALDPALLRPGRFDRTLYFDIPSKAGRRELLDYFLERRTHDEEMDREELREEFSAMTLGHTPAMLEHILDEALVWAIREGRRELNWRDIQRARLSEEIGLAQPVAYTDRERDFIATHEGGHAVAAYLCAKERKLEVLSIIKRRSALGLLAHSDTEERFTRTQSELEGTLKITLAGMAAEKLFFGESGTGPASDLVTATELAAQMVGSFGMGSSLISYEAASNGHGGPNIVAKILTNKDAKKEVEDLLRLHQDQVGYLLERNRDLVEALRDALLVQEELLGDDIAAVIEGALARRGPTNGARNGLKPGEEVALR